MIGKSGKKSRYEDLAGMLNRVLSEEFISPERLEECKDIEHHPEYVGELQVCITKWYQSQNRYGLAIATGLETLRSLLVPLWLQRGEETSVDIGAVTLEACRNENNRKASEAMLNDLQRFKTRGRISDDSEAMQLLQNLAESKKTVKPIRNRFAHNLLPKLESRTTDLNEIIEDGSETAVRKNDSVSVDKKKIDEFIKNLEALSLALRCTKGDLNAETIKSAYLTRPKAVEVKKVRGSNIRIIISEGTNYRDWQSYRRSNKNVFDVYVLPKEMIHYVRVKNRQKTKKFQEVINDAFILAQYIDCLFDTGSVTVILQEDLGYLQKVYFPPIFKEYGIKAVQLDGKILPGYELGIDYDSLKAETMEKFNESFQAINASPLPR